MKNEINDQLLFLDVLSEDGQSVYRKLTHSDRYLNAALYDPAHLYSVVKILTTRVKNLSDCQHLTTNSGRRQEVYKIKCGTCEIPNVGQTNKFFVRKNIWLL